MDTINLSKKEFNDLKNLVYSTSGINLHEGKLELLKSKIAKRMRLTNKSYKDYLKYLNSNQKEMIEFIDTMTTNHSFFFRENKNIEYIINQFNRHPQKRTKEFKIWCAACSTGDEPYTVALQLKNLGLSFSILATDLSHTVLDIAAKGIYKKEKISRVPIPILHQFFQKGTGKYTGHLKIKKEISQHVTFKKFNLVTDMPPPTTFDVVLCRNVMIYFDIETSEKVINKLYQTINPNGFFAIGNAESLLNLRHKYKSIKKIPSLYTK
ncbi:MAG: protein-glutamate O-methyltransferase CheR [Desulfobacteraceae bacterium]|nr:protein-glutamate O-methyltransferase CheR [Desulfobacteraceae bacterium]